MERFGPVVDNNRASMLRSPILGGAAAPGVPRSGIVSLGGPGALLAPDLGKKIPTWDSAAELETWSAMVQAARRYAAAQRHSVTACCARSAPATDPATPAVSSLAAAGRKPWDHRPPLNSQVEALSDHQPQTPQKIEISTPGSLGRPGVSDGETPPKDEEPPASAQTPTWDGLRVPRPLLAQCRSGLSAGKKHPALQQDSYLLSAQSPRRAPSAGLLRRKSDPQKSVHVSTRSREEMHVTKSETGLITRPSSSSTQGQEIEFSVSSPRLGSAAASANFELMPASLRHALLFIRGLPFLPQSHKNFCGGPFLPPPKPDTPRRTLVLDLDETLVHCHRGTSGATNGQPPLVPNLYVEFEDKKTLGSVSFRPFVNFFLDIAAKSYEIVVFTASQQHYADKVIDALDPAGKNIAHRLYRQHCTELRGAFFKELGLLGRPLSQCILVDNSPISLACNANNGVLIKSWYGDRWDEELIDLLGVLQESQAYGGDVDKFLAERYGLHEFFQALRCGGSCSTQPLASAATAAQRSSSGV